MKGGNGIAAKQRLRSLDILRGLTVAFMILVNNPGSWEYVYAPLEHAEWNGVTPTDFIFPSFIFIMGISMAFSLRKYHYRGSKEAWKKVLYRTGVLLLIGYATGWLSRFLYRITTGRGWHDAVLNFDTARVMGVMVRLALCYFFACLLIFLCKKDKIIAGVTVLLLILYAFLLYIGHGYEFLPLNIVGRVDRAVIPDAHLYHGMTVDGVSMTFDPEGILSTIGALSQTLLGYLMGKQILKNESNRSKIRILLPLSIVIGGMGMVLSIWMPLNKSVWSPSFVLVTSGTDLLLLCILMYLVDEKNMLTRLHFFESFGCNAMFLFILSTVVGLFFSNIMFTVDGEKTCITDVVFHAVYPTVIGNPYLVSLLWAVLYVLLMGLASMVLYRRKVYIKL